MRKQYSTERPQSTANQLTVSANLGDSGHAEQVGQRCQEAEDVQQASVVQVAEHSGPRRKPLSNHGSGVNMASGVKCETNTRECLCDPVRGACMGWRRKLANTQGNDKTEL
jgi:hypothetical protein